MTAYPELASAPGPYAIERKWGVFDPVLDPTNEQVYTLLDGFLGEMAALFPDEYLHLGGDENNGVQWSANAKIQSFIREHQLKDNAGLHAYFNGRVHAILAKHGKKMIGWDEIMHPDLPAGSVVHSWRGPDGIAAATAQGFATILSNGYYIDLNYPTVDHYLNDPVPAGTKLTAGQQKLVLGGEATMWAEWVTPRRSIRASGRAPRPSPSVCGRRATCATCRTCTAAWRSSAAAWRKRACNMNATWIRRCAASPATGPRRRISRRCALSWTWSSP